MYLCIQMHIWRTFMCMQIPTLLMCVFVTVVMTSIAFSCVFSLCIVSVSVCDVKIK